VSFNCLKPAAAVATTPSHQGSHRLHSLSLSLSLFTQKVCEPGPFRALFGLSSCLCIVFLFLLDFGLLYGVFFVAGFGIRVSFCHAPSIIMRRLALVVQSLFSLSSCCCVVFFLPWILVSCMEFFFCCRVWN